MPDLRVVSFVLLISSCVAGCGPNAAQLREQARQQDAANYENAAADCNRRYPEMAKQAVPRAQCFNTAANQYLRPYMPNPLQMDRLTSTRLVLAEQVQAGKISHAEGARQLTELVAGMSDQNQQRTLAERSVAAQENAANAARRAANRNVSCTRIGDTVNCY